jgi:hypothetical protein
MKIILGNKKENIELGDVLISDKGKYLVVGVNGKYCDYPIQIIDLRTMEAVNGFRNLSYLNESGYIEEGEDISKVIKSKNLVIKEVLN